MPNLLLYDAAVSLRHHPFKLALSIVLEARRNVGVVDIWPINGELQLCVFGDSTDHLKLLKNVQEIDLVLLDIQRCLYGEIKTDFKKLDSNVAHLNKANIAPK